MYIVPKCSERYKIPMASSNKLPQHIPTEDYGSFQLFARANIWTTACLTTHYECC